MNTVSTRAARDAKDTALYVRNILRQYARTDAETRSLGASWYAEAHADCLALAHMLDLEPRQVAGAAAAISPGLRWGITLVHVAMLHKAMQQKKRHVVPTYSRAFVDRARRILKGADPLAVLSGPKVVPFYRAIMTRGESSAPVIDGHAYNIARAQIEPIRDSALHVTPRRHRITATAYTRAAEKLNLPVSAVQASVWLAWRQQLGRIN